MRKVMELTLDVGFREIVGLLRQLPANQIAKIRNEFSEDYIAEKAKSEISDFRKFILAGPVMSDDQYTNFCQQRKHFNLWRSN